MRVNIDHHRLNQALNLVRPYVDAETLEAIRKGAMVSGEWDKEERPSLEFIRNAAQEAARTAVTEDRRTTLGKEQQRVASVVAGAVMRATTEWEERP